MLPLCFHKLGWWGRSPPSFLKMVSFLEGQKRKILTSCETRTIRRRENHLNLLHRLDTGWMDTGSISCGSALRYPLLPWQHLLVVRLAGSHTAQSVLDMWPHSSQVGEAWDVPAQCWGERIPCKIQGPRQGPQAAAWPPASCSASGCLFQDPGI